MMSCYAALKDMESLQCGVRVMFAAKMAGPGGGTW